ncbi:MAG TPA: hypothetical protein VGZ48_03655 [Candidatus Acidoferrales bacterium]|jgi:hypothetical protein|nr:hypothetical protein [Candidatus Acidoferrales bacterium]
MPTPWAKIKNRLEWLELGKTVGDLLVGAGVWKGLKFALSYIGSLPHGWVPSIALTCAGLVVFLLIWWQQRSRSAVALQRTQAQGTPAGSNEIPFPDLERVYKLYDPTLMAETEERLRRYLGTPPPGMSREDYLIRVISTGVWEYFYEVTWLTIFGSQIRAMEKMNTGLCKIDGIRKFYNNAALASPQYYSKYSFDEWLQYLFEKILIVQTGDALNTTVRGREFLKYLVQRGLSAEGRVL